MRVSILGTRVIRTEDPRFLTSGGVYTDDVADEQLAGACHVHFVRSAVAHARISSVDVSAALEAPGVVAVFTGADLADLPVAPPPMPGMINAQMGQPLLAADVIRYVGEPLAVVVTENRYQGEDAADLVDVDYEVLPAVVDMAGAAASQTVLFPAVGSNVAATFGDAAALAADLFDGCGAYPKFGAFLPALTILMAPGPYALPRAEAVATSVVTNTTPVGAYRGAGRPEATAAVERAMDLFAAEIGVDPAEVRRKNLLPAFTEPHTTAFGAVYDSGDYVTALDKALAAAGYEDLRREQAKRRADGDEVQLGIGLSCYVEITGVGGEAGGAKANATVEVHSDGSATILTGTSPHGQGHQTVWAMLASEELGIPIDKITLKWGDTDLIPEGGGTGGSRSLQQGA